MFVGVWLHCNFIAFQAKVLAALRNVAELKYFSIVSWDYFSTLTIDVFTGDNSYKVFFPVWLLPLE